MTKNDTIEIICVMRYGRKKKAINSSHEISIHHRYNQ